VKKLLVVSAVLLLLAAAAAPAVDLKIGAPAPDFTLPSARDGAALALKELSNGKAVVVMFIATKCPVSNAYNDRMGAIAREYSSKGIQFIGINSNKAEPAEEVAAHAREHHLNFPIVKDPGNKVADAYGAQKTPEVFVISPKGDLLYHGRIDESQDDPKGVKSPDLRNALEAILAGKPVPAAETKAFGCTIKRV
jgi:peroxiredoxin